VEAAALALQRPLARAAAVLPGPSRGAHAGEARRLLLRRGIRSAAFSLGALQALEERDELRRASYLAAVSGGSYIAAAISMVNKTGPGDSNPDLIRDVPAFAHGSPEEQYLRNRCSYLAPSLVDKLYLALRVVLGLAINLAFVSLPLIGVSLILTGLLYAPLLPGLTGSSILVVDYQVNPPGWLLHAPLWILAIGGAVGLVTLLFRSRDELQRFFATWATRLLLLAALAAAVLIAVPYLVEWLREAGNTHSAKSVASSNASRFGATTLALFVGVVAQLGTFLRSKTGQEDVKWARKAFSTLGSAARLTLAYAAGALFGPLLLILIFAGAAAVGMTETARDGSHAADWGLVWVGGGFLALFALFYVFADLTTWSLHPYYKRRLSSAFALKRVKVNELKKHERRRQEVVEPSPRGVALERDYDELVPISETALEESRRDDPWPTLIVCAAANVSDTAATPPGRAVTSFTFSAKSIGGPLVGAVETTKMERAFGGETRGEDQRKFWRKVGTWVYDRATGREHRHHDLSLPAAVAMSGAAISPSMGKMTARPLRFLMALANVRLGVWIPNPRWVAESGNGGLSPRLARPRPFYLVREFLGWNSIRARYLYVTDGGHYENLGLVELLRRGCTQVYCLDASGVSGNGAEFGALGEAIALARSELQVEIEFGTAKEGKRNPEELTPDEKTKLAKRDVVVATIRYPPKSDTEPGQTGRLVYVRNTMSAKAPWDVRAHHEADPRFPNNPTIDQLYTDQKFEAYRALGAIAGADAVEALKEP
jgi:hypothetical protein